MQLKIQRSQRTAGLMSKVVYAVNARIQLSPEEDALVRKYGLGKNIAYDSEARKQHVETAAATVRVGLIRGLAAGVMASLSLHVTIDSLMKGQVIETKSLDELIGAEDAIREACEKVKLHLEIAATFDEREMVFEY